MESVFFRAFPDMYASLLDYIKSRLMSDGSEVRMGLVFKPFTKKKQNKTEMRINMMTKESGSQDAYQVAIKKEESVLFDETDKDHED